MEYDVVLERKVEHAEHATDARDSDWMPMTERHSLFNFANNALSVNNEMTIRIGEEVTVVRKVLVRAIEPMVAEQAYLVSHPVAITQDDLRESLRRYSSLGHELPGLADTLLNALCTIQAQQAANAELEAKIICMEYPEDVADA